MFLIFLMIATTPPPGKLFVEHLAGGFANLCVAEFDATMTAKVPADALTAMWKSVTDDAGAFVKVEDVEVDSTDPTYRIEHVVIKFARGRRGMRVVYDKSNKVAGLFLRPAYEGRVRTLLAAFARRDPAAVAAWVSPTVAKLVSRELLAKAWDDIVAASGEYKRVRSVTDQGGALVADVEFTRGSKTLVFALDDGGRMLSMQLVDPWAPPAYVDRARFDERTVELGVHKLNAVLVVPKGIAKFPGVVLLAGSGATDADESIGPLKAFRDLAEGLASRGIAVLRFEKRTHKRVPVKNVAEEYLDDAAAAIALLAATAGVERVVLVGHSAGATFAPRLAATSPKLAGLGLLAGSTWPMSKLIVEQLVYQQKLGIPGLEPLLAQARAAAKQIDNPALKPDDVVHYGADTPGAYFLDLRGYSPVDTVAKLRMRVFIAWGEADVKVIPADFDGWRPLAKKPNVAFHTYPGLHHLFMPIGDPAGHVTPALVEDLAKWVKQ
jgi:pimeloyl-ACP methyl ester carboxylesterase